MPVLFVGLELPDLLIDILQHLGGFVLELVDRHAQLVDTLADHDILGLQNNLLQTLFKSSMAFPQLGVQVVQNFEPIDLA